MTALFAPPPAFDHARDLGGVAPCFAALAKRYFEAPKQNYTGGRGVLLSGNFGIGKTHTALAMARQLQTHIGRRLHIMFGTSQQIVRHVYPVAPERGVHPEETTTHLLETCCLLIIDELGAEPRAGGGHDYVTQRLRALLKARHDAKRLCFVTSNLRLAGPGGIEAEMGPGIASVLDGACPYQAQSDAPDRRSQKVERFFDNQKPDP